jgi:hypothetical protein
VGQFRFDGLTTSSSYTEFAAIYASAGTNSTTGAPTALTFKTSDGLVTAAERMRIGSGGNVSIGSTNTSLARLFIQGNTLANGNITLTGGIIANGSIGTAGQALVSNGSVAYWTNPPAVTTSVTAPSSPNDGDLWWDEDAGQLRIYYNDGTSAQWVDASSASGSGVFEPIVVNDISNQFDGTKSVFDLKLNQNYISTIGDSKDLEVTVNGMRLAPYIQELRWPWLTPYDSFKGFRALNGVPEPNTVKLAIYNSPVTGDSASVIVRSRSSSQQQNRYPFSASTISLGD